MNTDSDTALVLFRKLGPLIAPSLEQAFGRRDLCIVATRIAIEVAAYYGVAAQPMAVRTVLYNKAFAAHVANNFADVEDKSRPSSWGDDSWSVGIGCGKAPEPGRWDGHLIAVTDDIFADFSIQQAERLEHGIYTGPALVGPLRDAEKCWKAVHEPTGTVIEYSRIEDKSWRAAPDWRDRRRRRFIVAALIREVAGRF